MYSLSGLYQLTVSNPAQMKSPVIFELINCDLKKSITANLSCSNSYSKGILSPPVQPELTEKIICMHANTGIENGFCMRLAKQPTGIPNSRKSQKMFPIILAHEVHYKVRDVFWVRFIEFLQGICLEVGHCDVNILNILT